MCDNTGYGSQCAHVAKRAPRTLNKTQFASFSFAVQKAARHRLSYSACRRTGARHRHTMDERISKMIREGADIYVRRWKRYTKGLKRID